MDPDTHKQLSAKGGRNKHEKEETNSPTEAQKAAPGAL
jgi:hypothetical protein